MRELPSLTQRPATDDRAEWKVYWDALGQPWRTEPEISLLRQQFLGERRAIEPDSEKGIYPFRDERGSISLTRADVEWLLATHESNGMRGPVDWSDEKQRNREGLDLRGAHLADVDLSQLPLARLIGAMTIQQAYATLRKQRRMSTVSLERANLSDAHLEGAQLRGVSLTGADLENVRLESAVLDSSHLEGVNLNGAHLEGANIQSAFFDVSSYVRYMNITSAEYGTITVANVRWNGASLDGVEWFQVEMLGDERAARKPRAPDGSRKSKANRLQEFQRAVRANRQLATVLRDQGINEDANRFAYRARFLQRQVLRRQHQWLRWFGVLLLDLVAGYGYRPLRSVATYLLVVVGFAMAYLVLAPSSGHTLLWNEALVVSLTAFHGRGFVTAAFHPGDPQAVIAAVEAVIGLLIEIIFIATFTQRFFEK